MIASPLKVPKSNTKHWILNLNNYRNTHYQTLNRTKIEYKRVVKEQIETLTRYDNPIMLLYVLYPANRRRTDIGNVVSVHKKYFEDALVEFGKIEDDDYHHIVGSIEKFGYVDKDAPRVEIHIIDNIYEPITLYFKE